MAATEVFAKYEELCPWHHREPFADGVQEPIVLRPDDSYFVSWAPAPGNSTPGWITVSTPRVNAGVFLVQPGGWFDSGNHPGPEPYYIIKGTLHLSNPDTGDVIEVSAGEASNIPAFAYHHAHNFGDGWVDQEYIPADVEYYHPTDRGFEAKIKERLEELRKRKQASGGRQPPVGDAEEPR